MGDVFSTVLECVDPASNKDVDGVDVKELFLAEPEADPAVIQVAKGYSVNLNKLAPTMRRVLESLGELDMLEPEFALRLSEDSYVRQCSDRERLTRLANKILKEVRRLDIT
mmetsp:Transcript_148402/g.270160  ORF Transcript_148402/g.270160 Transcript_148402/m.270160 type:complete len:111 (-) Transcript_148402:100-432(-)